MKHHLSTLSPENPVGVLEHRIILPSGELRWQRWSDRAIFDNDGHIAEYQSVGSDTTERMEAELNLKSMNEELEAAYEQLTATEEELRQNYDELAKSQLELRMIEDRYRNIVEDQTEFICRFRPDGTHIFVNEAYCRYFGVTREEILGHRFRPNIPVEDQEHVKQFFAALTPDHSTEIIEHRIIMPDGSIRWQRWSDRAIFNPSGTVTEYQSVGRDTTELKQADDVKKRLTQNLSLLNSITHHDINNQLAVAEGYMKLAAFRNPDPAIAEFLAKVASAIVAIKHQIEFTRTYQNLGVNAPAWFRVCDVIRSVKPPDITLVCTCDSCEIFADPMIMKVFFNLFDNAVKYGKRVTTVTAGCEQAGDELVISFTDNGVGIPPDKKELIFERGFGKNTRAWAFPLPRNSVNHRHHYPGEGRARGRSAV